MLRVLESGQIESSDLRFPVALEAIRDFYQLRLIVDEMETHINDSKFLGSLERMLHDAAAPQGSNGNTPGRDTQFELFVAAIAIRAGMLPVDYDEPDITCHVEGIKFGIAAKRLKSLEKFEKRIREGAKQIGRSNFPGIIACELTIARNPENRPITSSFRSQLATVIGITKYQQLFDRYEKSIHQWVAKAGVRALVVFDFTYRVSPDNSSWIHDGMMCWFPTTNGNRTAELELNAFQQQFIKGIPNLHDLNDAS